MTRSLHWILASLLVSAGGSVAAQDALSPGFASYRAHLAAAEAALREGDAALALEWLAGAPAEHAGWELDALRARTDASRSTWPVSDGAVSAVAWHPGGTQLASASAGGTLDVRDVADGSIVFAVELKGGRPSALGWESQGAVLACALEGETLVLLDGASGEILARSTRIARGPADPNRTPRAIDWSPDGTQLAVAWPGRIDVHDAFDASLLREVNGSKAWPLACAARYDESGERLTTVFWDGLVKILDAASGEIVERQEPPARLEGFHAFHDLRLDPSLARIGGACFDGSVRVHTLAGGADVIGKVAHARQCYTAVFSPDGARLAAGYAGGALRLWDASSGVLVTTWLGHLDDVLAVAFSPDGTRLASGSSDGTIRLWDSAEPRGSERVLRAGDAVWSAPFSPDGRRIATAASDGRVLLWDLESGREVATFGPFRREATSVAFTPDGQRLVVATNEEIVRCFDLDTPGEPLELKGHTGGVPNLHASSDGRRVASASYDGSVRIWNLETGASERRLSANAYDCAFSPDGARLAYNDGTAILVVDVESGERLMRMDDPPHVRTVSALAWSPDGSLLASGCLAGSLRLWDVASGSARLARNAHDAALYGLAFHPDGSRFASASYDASVSFWSPSAPRELCTYRGLPEKAYFVDFSPSGERLSVSTLDGSVTLFATRRTE